MALNALVNSLLPQSDKRGNERVKQVQCDDACLQMSDLILP